MADKTLIDTILDVVERGQDQGDIPGGDRKWFLISDATIAELRARILESQTQMYFSGWSDCNELGYLNVDNKTLQKALKEIA